MSVEKTRKLDILAELFQAMISTLQLSKPSAAGIFYRGLHVFAEGLHFLKMIKLH